MRRSRITARAAAMQTIYEHIAGGEGGDESLLMIYDELREETADTEDPVEAEEPGLADRDFIRRASEGVYEHQAELEEKIAAASRGWTVERMPWVDRTILLLGAWEILYANDPEVPGPVAINEAVELAKRYSDPDKSSRFINGVLGTILRAANAKEQAE